MQNDKILNMLGLCARARCLVSGEFSTEKAIKGKKVKLVIVALDASDNTKKLFNDKCNYYNVPLYMYSNKENLGKAIGKTIRSSVGIMDNNFSIAIEKLLK